MTILKSFDQIEITKTKTSNIKLVGMRWYTWPSEGKISMPATESYRGAIVIGPGTDGPIKMEKVTVNYWVFHPVRFKIDGKKIVIRRSPSLVLTDLLKVSCKCGEYRIWKDVVQVIEAKEGKFICPKCKAVEHPKADRVVPALCGSETAVFKTAEELLPLSKAMETKTKITLPRVWGVYTKSLADWTPSSDDPIAIDMYNRVRKNGHFLLPYDIALKVENVTGVLVKFLIDVPAAFNCGYIDISSLCENRNMGYKIRLMEVRQSYSV